ncbi:MAG: hypothetical protein ABJD11_06320 [Gemmatimonadota bacterium]
MSLLQWPRRTGAVARRNQSGTPAESRSLLLRLVSEKDGAGAPGQRFERQRALRIAIGYARLRRMIAAA